MAELEYQHIVPRTYFKPWENPSTNRQLNIVDKTTGIVDTKTSKREFGVKDFYTITIDNYYIFTEADKQITYKPLANYDIEFEGKKLTTIEDYHLNFGILEKWIVNDKGGNPVNTKDLYNELKKTRILDLEKNWNQVAENNWNNTVIKIADCINQKVALESNEYDFLYAFLASQKLRTPLFKEKYITNELNRLLSGVFELPNDDKEKELIKQDFEKMYDSLYKRIIREFQEGNDLNKTAESIKKFVGKLTLRFCYNNNKAFYTSDNPICDEVDSTLPNKYKGLIFPLTPHLIVIGYLGNKDDNQYIVQELSDVEVDEINNIIIKNAYGKYIRD